MFMSAAAAAPADANAPAKPKSKKMLFIIVGVLVLALVGAGGAFFLMKKNASGEEGAEEEEPAPVHHADPKAPPVFLPLDPMVVNLADPGGNRFAQLTITLQVDDPKTGDAMKIYMPAIRNAILFLISQRTAEEMLLIEGKEKLAEDIVTEVSHVMDYEIDEAEAEAKPGASEAAAKPAKKKRRRAPPNPLQGVLFSSFIVQ
jgi:flagellar FliL protein